MLCSVASPPKKKKKKKRENQTQEKKNGNKKRNNNNKKKKQIIRIKNIRRLHRRTCASKARARDRIRRMGKGGSQGEAANISRKMIYAYAE